MGFGVQGLGFVFVVEGLGFGVWGLGVRVPHETRYALVSKHASLNTLRCLHLGWLGPGLDWRVLRRFRFKSPLPRGGQRVFRSSRF